MYDLSNLKQYSLEDCGIMKSILFIFGLVLASTTSKPQFPIVRPEEPQIIEERPPPRVDSVSDPSLSVEECYKACPKVQQYNPVCGSDGVTYINMQYIRCAQSCGMSK